MARRRDISKGEILDAARRLLQLRGCNGFSVRDVSGEVGITTASLHYHFPTKSGLIAEILRQDCAALNERLVAIESEAETFTARLELIREHLLSTQQEPGSLGPALVGVVDMFTLPAECQTEVQQWFLSLEGWLTRFAMQARTAGEIPQGQPLDALIARESAALLAAMLLKRARCHLSPLQGFSPRLASKPHGHARPPSTGLS